MASPRPTLLVFTLGAQRESRRRPLLPGELRGLEVDLRQSCLTAALEAGRRCGCGLEICSPSGDRPADGPAGWPADALHVPQAEGGFGVRLEAAVSGAFRRGASPLLPLLVVGTDVPGLTASHLEEALALLAADPERVVLGPSPDGGFYLLAATRPIEGLGDAVRWCRSDTLESLLQLLRAAGRPVVLLAPLADLDRPADLTRWLAGGSVHDNAGDRWTVLRRLQARLRRVLAERRRPLEPVLLGGPRVFRTADAGRAPPLPSSC